MSTNSSLLQSERGAEHELVERCLEGSEEAWGLLVDKYKNLIFSIPLKYGLSRADAADVFQSVCLELLSELPKIRDPKALPKWLCTVASHQCYHFMRRTRLREAEAKESARSFEEAEEKRTDEVLAEAEQEQKIREVIESLQPRCRSLIRMLFFEDPPRPYAEIASSLSLATGSIGFIRHRCLEKVRSKLEELRL